ncbi:hypothetical protein MVLG_00545 [Microbotryum lychnidis-dioicae p1A1 Lamole]|uniref:RING-type domain-containing protein n=1 Tax=Microbotryum lychnidis-dioicae (strain p1A1 Lamole / MvSl-1064) TaxID=683840 RepID=U5GZE2_USTV1|nr:hypothetical protein MVLG_00545 [Microbotryum lychnidis-dioicae p1A1 Lamole]|eukprot:KDE09224.1 hypothetical protein MVLG_00545 [Microbotryum lychnidis-dioicae p1A1 Lamole]
MPRVKRSASALVNDDDNASRSFSSNSTSRKGVASAPIACPTGSSQRRASNRTTSPYKRLTRKNPAQDDDHHTTEMSPRGSTRRRTTLAEHSQGDSDRSSSLEVLEPAAIAATTKEKGKPTLSASSSTTLEQDDLRTNSVTHNDDSITTDITEPEPELEPAKSEVIDAELRRKNKASSQTSTTSDRDQDDMISKAEVRLRVQKSMAAWAKERQSYEDKLKANNTFIDQQDELLRQLTQFTDSLRATAQCGICLQTMRAPHALECGHVFCRQCLINCFFSANNGDDDDDDDEEEEADQDNEENLSRSGSNSHTDSDSSNSELEGNDASLSFWEADQPPTPPEGMETIRLTVGNRSFQMNRPEPGYRPPQATAEDSASRFVELGSDDDDDDDDDEREFEAIGAAREGIARVERIEPAVSLRHRSPRENDSTSPATSPGRAPAAGARIEDRIIIADEEVHQAGPVPPMAHPPSHPSNVICPSCRTKVDTAPKRIFVLTDLVHRIRQAEQEGLIGDLDESAPPKSDKADEMEVTIDEHDKSWGGLFMELDVGGNTKGRTRVARDRDDGVRRCPECSWEIIEATGECAHCQRVYELSSDEDFRRRHHDGGAESDDERSDISVRSMPRHGVRRPREEEEEEQPNSEDEAFIDDAPIRKRRRTDGEASSRRRRRKSEVASSDEESRLEFTSDAALSLSSGSDGDSDSESAVSTSSSRHSDSTQKSSEASFSDEGRDATKRRRKARREVRRAEEEKARRRGRGKGKELSEVEDEYESVIIEESHESPRKAAAKAAIRRAEEKGSGEEVTETSAKASTSARVDKGSKEKSARKGWRKLPKITHSDDEDE